MTSPAVKGMAGKTSGLVPGSCPENVRAGAPRLTRKSARRSPRPPGAPAHDGMKATLRRRTLGFGFEVLRDFGYRRLCRRPR